MFRNIKFQLSFPLVLMLCSSSVWAQPDFNKVMIVVLENTNYNAAITQTFLADLAKRGARLDNMTALTHPSQGNYVSMIAGDTFGINSDKNIDLDQRHIGDLLEEKGLTWKVYAEDYPGDCFLGGSKGNYARKHVPFLSFKNVSTNLKRCGNIVNASQLDSDITSGNLSNYSLYIPNLKNDGHNTGVSFADQFMSKKFGPLLKDPKFMDHMLFIVTFDESGSNKTNQIYTAAFGSSVITGAKSAVTYTHYSILKTIESVWNLGSLGKKDSNANAIFDVLK